MSRNGEVTVEVRQLGARPGSDAGATLVLLHGYGSNEQDLVSVLPVLGAALPGISAQVLAVRGLHALAGRPGAYSWFPGDVWVQPSAESIAASVDRLADAVADYADRAIWLGFSQGMCAAVTVMRRRPELVSGVIALSGFSFDVDQPGDARLAMDAAAGRGIPAFYGRDPADPAVPDFASGWALRYLRTHTALTERSYPGLGHSLSMPELTDIVTFLAPLLRGEVAGRTGTE